MLKDTTVGVVGGGVVGAATARSLVEHVKEVRVFDTDPRRRTHHLASVADCDITFLCLPTPQCKGSLECDTDAVERMLVHFGGLMHDRNLVLKSTVPIGFTRQMAEKYHLTNLVHSPEFLTARCADADAAMPNRLVIGHTSQTLEFSPAGRKLETLYQTRWPGVPVLTMRSDDSEALKLFTNSFFATKVAFFNEINDFATRKGLDWEVIVAAMRLDRHINPAHTQVPGPDGRRGYGGACLPKDIASLVYQMDDCDLLAYPPRVCQAAIDRNGYDRNRGK
jgi:UDPglucose 6-dehydrogenase